MNWVTIIFASALSLVCLANQETPDVGSSAVLRQNLSNRNVPLDPVLKKALLKALVELEKEAEEKLKAEESRSIRSESRQTVGNFVRSENDGKQAESNFQRSQTTDSGSEESSNNLDSTNAENSFEPSKISPAENRINNNGVEESNDSSDSPNFDLNFDTDVKDEEKNSDGDSNKESKNDENKKEGKTETERANEVDIFKAPLVAAFTVHQDSQGTPHSVVPLFSKGQGPNYRQQGRFFDQQYAALNAQQQQQQNQFFQNQLISAVTTNPLSQLKQFDQSRYFVPATVSPNFSPSTVFPTLTSNSIIPQGFTPISSPSFHASTTVSPFDNGNRQIVSSTPQRNFSPEPFSRSPQQYNGVTVLPSQSISLPSPSPAPNFASAFHQPINIPSATLPLQNEGRFNSPVVVPSQQTNPNRDYLENQREQERIRNQLRIEERNRLMLDHERNRIRQLQEQNRQRQLEEERQRRLYEEAQYRLRQQRQEHGVDFQRSLGFAYNQNYQSAFVGHPSNAYTYNVQPSQGFLSSPNLHNPVSRNRVNRQEGFGSTGNFGLSHSQTRNQFRTNQIYPSVLSPQEYRTIPDEYYRQSNTNQFYHNNNYRFGQFGQPQAVNYEQNRLEDVNAKLKNLLYQSGFRDASGQEDLNIVSKVLALNHQRSDSTVEDKIYTNKKYGKTKKM